MTATLLAGGCIREIAERCSDGKDNDGDGLVDCSDHACALESHCCSQPAVLITESFNAPEAAADGTPPLPCPDFDPQTWQECAGAHGPCLRQGAFFPTAKDVVDNAEYAIRYSQPLSLPTDRQLQLSITMQGVPEKLGYVSLTITDQQECDGESKSHVSVTLRSKYQNDGEARRLLVAECAGDTAPGLLELPSGDQPLWVTITLESKGTARFRTGFDREPFHSCRLNRSERSYWITLAGAGNSSSLDNLIVSGSRPGCSRYLDLGEAVLLPQDRLPSPWTGPADPALVATPEGWHLFFTASDREETGIFHLMLPGEGASAATLVIPECPLLASIPAIPCRDSFKTHSPHPEHALRPYAPAAAVRKETILLFYGLSRSEWETDIGIGASLSEDGGESFQAVGTITSSGEEFVVIQPDDDSSSACCPSALWTDSGIEVFWVTADRASGRRSLRHSICTIADSPRSLSCQPASEQDLVEEPDVTLAFPYLTEPDLSAPAVTGFFDPFVMQYGPRHMLFTDDSAKPAVIRHAVFSSEHGRWIADGDFSITSSDLGLDPAADVRAPTGILTPDGIFLMFSHGTAGNVALGLVEAKRVPW